MKQKKLKIINRLGLHARAAAKLVSLANQYQATIEISCNDKKANGKSIMAVMMLAASEGLEVDIVIKGDDETELLIAVEQLITNRFDEPS